MRLRNICIAVLVFSVYFQRERNRKTGENLKRRNRRAGGIEVLKTSRLEPAAIGGSLQKVVRVLTLVVHPSRTRSLPLPSHPVHVSQTLYNLRSKCRVRAPLFFSRIHFLSLKPDSSSDRTFRPVK